MSDRINAPQTADKISMEDLFGPVVYAYTRAQAIEDGVLIDVSATAKEAGIKFPVAVTAEVWSDCVAWSDEDSKRKGGCPQDESGRLWDAVYMMSVAIRRSNGGDTIRYQFYRVPKEGKGRKPRLVTVKAVCGPGDNGEPVITIMGENES